MTTMPTDFEDQQTPTQEVPGAPKEPKQKQDPKKGQTDGGQKDVETPK